MSLHNTPVELKTLANWVGWKWEEKKNSRGEAKLTKPPYDLKSNGTLCHARTDDPSTWASFAIADAAKGAFDSRFDGVGFVLPAGMGGVDFDGVIHDERVESFVLEILKHCGNPYAESTPSGDGIRAFINAPTLPAGPEKKRKFHGKKDGVEKYGAEIYFGVEPGRYLTVTGEKLEGSGDGITTPPDIDLVHLLMSQIGDEKFKSLWMGDTTAYGNDQSSADLALVNRLARLTNNDRARLEKYFGASVLGQRDKWTKRKDYRERTLDAALKGKESEKEPTKELRASKQCLPPAPCTDQTGSYITPKRVKWLWQNRIPLGKITLFAGNPDNGKSLAAIDLAARVTTGLPFPDGVNTFPASDVLMMLGEDDLEDTAVPRLMAAGANLDFIHFLETTTGVNGVGQSEIRLDENMPNVEASLQKYPNARLLVVDPISNYLGRASMVSEQEVREKILMPLKRLAEKHRVAVVLIMHLNKKSDLEAISRVGGAMAFVGVARASWLFIRDASSEEGEIKDSFSMARIKSNLTKASAGGTAYHIQQRPVMTDDEGEVFAPYVVWDGVVQKSADDVMASHHASRHEGPGRPVGGANTKVERAKHFLAEKLANGPVDGEEIKADAAGLVDPISRPTLRRAASEMKIKAPRVGKKYLWTLPPMNAIAASVAAAEPQEERARAEAVQIAGEESPDAIVEQVFELK